MELPVNDKYVRILGRTIEKNGIRYLGYSCSGIEFEFEGRRASAVLWSDSYRMDDIYCAWAAVFVNDEETPSRRFPLKKEEDIYILYEGEKTAKTKIRFVKYSEAAFGKVGIKSIIIDGENTPVPTEERPRKLEFIGDSITCGYGIEGRWNADVFNTAKENPWLAYAAQTARALAADYNLVSWSGIGVLSSWTDKDVPLNDWLMPELYPYTDKAADIALCRDRLELWDFKRFQPDCIIINLGTNDASYTKDIKERIENFGLRYYHFIRQVRESNPYSEILCTLGVMGQVLCGEMEHRVSLLKKEGDSRIRSMIFEVQSEEDGIGTDWHPSIKTHEKMAAQLTKKIRKIMSWN